MVKADSTFDLNWLESLFFSEFIAAPTYPASQTWDFCYFHTSIFRYLLMSCSCLDLFHNSLQFCTEKYMLVFCHCLRVYCHNWCITIISPAHQVEAKFEEMMTDMNLTDDSKRAPLRSKSIQEKKNMLLMQYRGAAIQVFVHFDLTTITFSF